MKVPSVDVIHGWRSIIHGWRNSMHGWKCHLLMSSMDDSSICGCYPWMTSADGYEEWRTWTEHIPEFENFFFFANSSVWFIYFWYLLVAHIQIDLESLVLCKYPKKCQGCKKVLSCPDSVLRLTLSKPVIFELQKSITYKWKVFWIENNLRQVFRPSDIFQYLDTFQKLSSYMDKCLHLFSIL